MRTAILGCGFIAEFHLDAWNALEGTRVCAVCDSDEARAKALAGKAGCAYYTDAVTLMEKERPDAVSVCLPTFLHAQYAASALERGIHVLCEKPMALRQEDCEAMVRAARKSGKVLMIAQVLRWWPEYAAFREELSRLGTPSFLRARRVRHSSREGWFVQPDQGGGALFDLAVHAPDWLCGLMGCVPDQSGAGARFLK